MTEGPWHWGTMSDEHTVELQDEEYRKRKCLQIQLLDVDEFLACRVATTVLDLTPDRRVLRELADIAIERGYEWCTNRMPEEKILHAPNWWRIVAEIEQGFDWVKFHEGDPITAKLTDTTLEFGSFKRPEPQTSFGGGCHRTIALAVAIRRPTIAYEPFRILLRRT